MAQTRTDLGFAAALDGLDPDRLVPAPPRARPAPHLTATAGAAAGFVSREAPPPPDEQGQEQGPGQGAARRRRTGRSAQLNLKARPETIAAYCALADRMGWGLGETLERAVALLQAEYGRPEGRP